MLTLKTGTPGSGKSLTAVAELQKASEREAVRPVFVHGIPDLALPFIPLPVFAPVVMVKGQPQAVQSRGLEVDWSVVPDGALVVIDEAQHVFPTRPAGSAVPGYVGFLNTHRHRGIDILLITQHPRLIDGAVRKLVGKHQHYRRVFGGRRHVCYEWDHCSEALGGMAEATKRLAGFPSRAFTAYKSAEVHTRPAFAKPLWLAVPVIAVGALVWVGPMAYRTLRGEIGGEGVGAAVSSAPASSPTRAAAARLASDARLRERGGVPLGKPIGTGLVHPALTMPALLAGCWTMGATCSCTTNEVRVRVLAVDPSLCGMVARGELGPDPARPMPIPARSSDSAASAPAVEPGRAASAPGLGAA